jgi:hypothetical protein
MDLLLTAEDRALLAGVDWALADGVRLKHWWEERRAIQHFAERFWLRRSFNPAGYSFGFFDVASLARGPLAVMGLFQELSFDASKPISPPQVRDELREFVLRYFMRVSSLRLPEAYPSGDPSSQTKLGGPLSWCPTDYIDRVGFGFSQLFYKEAGTGQIGRFPPGMQYEIIDLREIGSRYEWILAKVQLYAFNLKFQPFGPDGPGLTIPLGESQYLLISPHFVLDDNSSTPASIGRFHTGYALLRNPGPTGLLAYGPGEFLAGFQTIEFTVEPSGAIRAGMAFVVDRPRQILNVPVNPVRWGMIAASLFSEALASRFQRPFDVGSTQSEGLGFDPFTAFIDTSNYLTAGLAEREFCVSLRTLELDFLVQHFQQHYEMIVGATSTWNQVANWLDSDTIPLWVKKGVLA